MIKKFNHMETHFKAQDFHSNMLMCERYWRLTLGDSPTGFTLSENNVASDSLITHGSRPAPNKLWALWGWEEDISLPLVSPQPAQQGHTADTWGAPVYRRTE